MNKFYKPTEAIKKNALRALAIKNKYNREVKETIAKSLVVGEVPLDQVKEIYAALVKSKADNKTRDADSGPTVEYLDYLLHGGSAALAWTRKILKEENILKSHKKEITEEQLNKEEHTELNAVQICKSVNEELKQATYVVLVPDVVDAHGDTYDSNEVRKACHSFNKSSAKASLLHLLETDGFHVAESYIAPVDVILGDTLVQKGTWLVNLQFNDDELWQGVKDGLFSGVSIGAMARVQEV